MEYFVSAALTGLLFGLVDASPWKSWHGFTECRLRYAPRDAALAGERVEHVFVGGIDPVLLMELRVCCPAGVQVYASKALYDAFGRCSSGGEILAALYGKGPHGLRVPAAEFAGPAIARETEVELTVRLTTEMKLDRIVVLATTATS